MTTEVKMEANDVVSSPKDEFVATGLGILGGIVAGLAIWAFAVVFAVAIFG